jgi:outer membrane receptor protein involved in Fe transport
MPNFRLSATVVACLPGAAWAQALPVEPATPVIVVTGRGLAETPATPAYDSQTIARERLASSASGRIEDALAGVAGFQQFRRSDSRSANPSAQGATLRALGGNATSRTLVLLDGVPMADPFFGYIPFSAIPPESLARARVTRGGGSGAFGAGAVAGTIELDSAGPGELGLVGVSGLVDDRGEGEFSGALAPRLGQGFAVLGGRWDRGQGFWTTPREQRVPASVRARYASWSAGLRGVAPLGDTVELQARGLVYDDRRTLRFAGADSTSRGQDASLRLVGRGRWAFEALGYVQARDFSNVVISSTSFRKTLDQRRTPSTGLGGKLEVRPPIGRGHLARLGADLRVADGELQEEAYSAVTGLVTARRRAGGRNSDLGLFVEDDWTLGRLVLSAGARADRWTIRDGFFAERNAGGATTADQRFADRAGWDVSLRGGAVLDAGKGFKLRAAAYSGVRVPTLNELYRPFVVFPVTTRANAALQNERLRGFEGGVDYSAGPLRLSLTAFDNRLRDAVANATIGPSLRQRRNVDAVHARGLELGAHAGLGGVEVDGSLAWTDAEFDASGISAALDGKRPAQTPRLFASATLAFVPAAGWRLAATLRHVGRQFEDDLETDALPAATTLDAYARAPVSGPISLILRAENLTGERIVTRNQGGSVDLGAPRTLWAGLALDL